MLDDRAILDRLFANDSSREELFADIGKDLGLNLFPVPPPADPHEEARKRLEEMEKDVQENQRRRSERK